MLSLTRRVLLLVLCGCLAEAVKGDEADIDPLLVRRLVDQLEGRQGATGDKAEEQLRALGPEVIPLLPEINARTSGELKQRLLRIRADLEKLRLARFSKPSRVRLVGEMSLSEALAAIEEQTGNVVVDYRSNFNQQPSDNPVEVDIRDVSFWPALDQLLDQTGLTVSPFVGESYKLAVIGRGQTALDRHGRADYEGLFRIEPTGMEANRDLRDPGQNVLRLRLEIMWEPRVRPILIRHDLDSVTVTGSNGSAMDVTASGSNAIPVLPNVAAVDTRLLFALPDRDIKEISTLSGEFEALVPGGEVAFEFDDLVGARNVQQRKGGITVVLERVRRNRSVQEVNIRLRLDQAGSSLQSHLDWVENNQILLFDADGRRADEPGLEKTLERENEVGYRYLFPVEGDLKGWKLVYKTPAGVSQLPVRYELKNISLP